MAKGLEEGREEGKKESRKGSLSSGTEGTVLRAAAAITANTLHSCGD